jgi:hypothetical protein
VIQLLIVGAVLAVGGFAAGFSGRAVDRDYERNGGRPRERARVEAPRSSIDDYWDAHDEAARKQWRFWMGAGWFGLALLALAGVIALAS